MARRLVFPITVLCASLLGISSCGKPPVRETGVFESFVQSFESHAARHGRVPETPGLIVEFGRVQGGEAGHCVRGSKRARVLIDPDEWAKLGHASQESLIYHELGHCLLRRDHLTRWIADEARPASLMNETLVDGEVYLRFKQQYLEELFTGA